LEKPFFVPFLKSIFLCGPGVNHLDIWEKSWNIIYDVTERSVRMRKTANLNRYTIKPDEIENEIHKNSSCPDCPGTPS
jgi:hypothetical protein